MIIFMKIFRISHERELHVGIHVENETVILLKM